MDNHAMTTSRRNLLRGSAVGVGGLALGAGMTVAAANAANAAPRVEEDGAAYYLKLQGITGGTQTSEEVIELLSFRLNTQAPTGPSKSSGAGAGKVTHQPMIITKQLDKSSPNLFLACASGKVIKTGILIGTYAGASDNFLTIQLTDIVISEFDTTAETDDSPTETVQLNFSKIEFRYNPNTGSSPTGSSSAQ